jgi:hypothetical protein
MDSRSACTAPRDVEATLEQSISHLVSPLGRASCNAIFFAEQ